MNTEPRISKEQLPWLMAAARGMLGPVMILAERAQWNGIALTLLVVAGLFSDIFDGFLARRWKCDTAAVRLFDSMADIVFYAGCAIALWMRHPQLVRGLAQPIAGVVALEALCFAVAFVKFGRPPSFHSYLAKTWGLALACALVAAFLTTHPAVWIVAALALGALSNLEGLAMSLVMPAWRQDVKTLAVAWRLRGIARRRASRFIPSAVAAAVIVFASCALPLHAQKSGQAIYEIGTSAVAANTIAPLVVSPDALRFESPTPLTIPYDTIDAASWRKDVREHMGFFPAMFIGMVAAREHVYRLTLSYHDTSGANQVAVFQLTRNDAISLSELLRTRVSRCKQKNFCLALYDDF